MARSLALTWRQGFISRPNFQFEIQSHLVGPLSHGPVCSPALRTASSTALVRNSDVHGLMELARAQVEVFAARESVGVWMIGAVSGRGAQQPQRLNSCPPWIDLSSNESVCSARIALGAHAPL